MSVGINGKTTGGVTGKGFLPGQSGNPSGRPKARAWLRQVIRAYLYGEHPVEKDKTRLQVLLARLEKEDPRALLAYGFGKPDKSNEASRPATVYPAPGQPRQTRREGRTAGGTSEDVRMMNEWRGSSPVQRGRSEEEWRPC